MCLTHAVVSCRAVPPLTLAAKLPLHLHPRFLQHGNEYMGDRHELDHLRAAERRSGWCGMGLFHRLDGLLHRLRLDCRDGLDVRCFHPSYRWPRPNMRPCQGTNFRRTVSLGLRVLPEKLPEISQLCRRLDLRPGLANWAGVDRLHCGHADPGPHRPEQRLLHIRALARLSPGHRNRRFRRSL